ncbi:MAG: hypothetical protein ACX939_08130, partial [Hyphococcus sp.]
MSNEQDKTDKDAPASDEAPPEVAAEVVSDTLGEEAAGDADDDQPGAAETAPDDSEPAVEKPARRSTLTPGVILFIVFAVTALLIFAGWRLQSNEAARYEQSRPRVSDSDERAASSEGQMAPSSAVQPDRVAEADPSDRIAAPTGAGASSDADNAAGFNFEAGASGESGAAGEQPEAAGADLKIANDLTAMKESLEDEIAGLKGALSAAQERNAALRAEIESLRRDFQAAIEARDAANSNNLSDLAARLGKIENTQSVESGRRAAAALALNDLRYAVATGEPFTEQLSDFLVYVAANDQTATLSAHAATGAPTLAFLEEEFQPAARLALAAAGKADAEGALEELAARARS